MRLCGNGLRVPALVVDLDLAGMVCGRVISIHTAKAILSLCAKCRRALPRLHHDIKSLC